MYTTTPGSVMVVLCLNVHCSLNEFFLRWDSYYPECQWASTPQPGTVTG